MQVSMALSLTFARIRFDQNWIETEWWIIWVPTVLPHYTNTVWQNTSFQEPPSICKQSMVKRGLSECLIINLASVMICFLRIYPNNPPLHESNVLTSNIWVEQFSLHKLSLLKSFFLFQYFKISFQIRYCWALLRDFKKPSWVLFNTSIFGSFWVFV